MQHFGISLSLTTIATLVISLYIIIKAKNDRVMFYTGLLLIAFGVILSAFSGILTNFIYENQSTEANHDRTILFSNLFLVIAAIGANFLSTSIVTRNKQQTEDVKQKIENKRRRKRKR